MWNSLVKRFPRKRSMSSGGCISLQRSDGVYPGFTLSGFHCRHGDRDHHSDQELIETFSARTIGWLIAQVDCHKSKSPSHIIYQIGKHAGFQLLRCELIDLCHCKFNSFGLWTLEWTKQDIWRHHCGCWEIMMSIFRLVLKLQLHRPSSAGRLLVTTAADIGLWDLT